MHSFKTRKIYQLWFESHERRSMFNFSRVKTLCIFRIFHTLCRDKKWFNQLMCDILCNYFKINYLCDMQNKTIKTRIFTRSPMNLVSSPNYDDILCYLVFIILKFHVVLLNLLSGGGNIKLLSTPNDDAETNFLFPLLTLEMKLIVKCHPLTLH